jgi:hypothetical protein
MPRITITRDHRPIGFIEITGRELAESQAVLPGLEGDQRGLAIVSEVANTPVAALVLPFDGDAIEVSEVVQWHGGDKGASQSKSRLSDERALLSLAGDCRVSGEGGRFDVSFRSEQQSGRGVERDVSLNLEIHDEENRGFLHCDIRGGQGFGRGPLRGHLRGGFQTESREASTAAEFWFDLLGHFGHGEMFGRLRALAEGESGSAGFRFSFDYHGRGRGMAEGNFRGEAAGIPLLWFIQQTVIRIRTGSSVPFRIWIGAVRYSPEPKEARLARQEIADLLSSTSRFTARDLGRVAHWLAHALPATRQAAYMEAMYPLLRIQLPEETADIAFRQRKQTLERTPSIARKDFNITFDDSVTPEKALRFLIALSEECADAGGRLCFAQRTNGES